MLDDPKPLSAEEEASIRRKMPMLSDALWDTSIVARILATLDAERTERDAEHAILRASVADDGVAGPIAPVLDPPEHHCARLDAARKSYFVGPLRFYKGEWQLLVTKHSWALGPIEFCPFCGRNLEADKDVKRRLDALERRGGESQ